MSYRVKEITVTAFGTDLTVEVKCDQCLRTIDIDIPRTQWNNWIGGMEIQTAIPVLSESQRELLISGLCVECFDSLFLSEQEV